VIHPPGSDEAIAHGCLCPVSENMHGKGRFIVNHHVFWINGLCPLHHEHQEEDVPSATQS
jgi:hypothetical protein